MTRITGISREEIVGKDSLVTSRVIGDLVSEPHLQKALAGESVVSEKSVPSLSSAIYRLHYSPLRNNEGSVTGGIAVLRNITEPTQTQDDAHDAYRRLRF